MLIAGTAIILGLLFGLSGCNQTEDANIVTWPVDSNCNLHTEACTAQMGEAEATLKISPHPLPIARPLGIEVAVKHLEIESIELDISGINMYMGYNRVPLSADGTNRYIGTSMLAFCTSQTMQWQITLMIHQKDGTQIQIPYLLETVNR
ncbi:MAG: hypothetical protein GXO35_09170 [Gammaproteobacteria bacterium]|nr:hypothetical protein [Gammaproteobacteria bacterium]